MDPELDNIIARLQHHDQRATYGAVAGVLQPPRNPQFFMQPRERNHFNSWVVNQETGQPTGYTPAQEHPNLYNNNVIVDAGALQIWLQAHP
jgi:hypothetical protein